MRMRAPSTWTRKKNSRRPGRQTARWCSNGRRVVPREHMDACAQRIPAATPHPWSAHPSMGLRHFSVFSSPSLCLVMHAVSWPSLSFSLAAEQFASERLRDRQRRGEEWTARGRHIGSGVKARE